MENVTLEKIAQQGSPLKGIEWAKSQYQKHSLRTLKPQLKQYANSTDVREYANSLEAWEEIERQRIEVDKAVRAYNQAIDCVIEEFIKSEAGLNTVPQQYQDKLYNKAYQDGHSSGYYEVFLKLNSLIEIFD